MKNFVLLLPMLLAFCFSSYSQNSLQLNIHHKLGEEAFALNTEATNNLGQVFKVTRLEYYLSEISILHDGGAETTIEDLWVLVDASEATQIDLGSHNINEVEAIRLHVGVDPDHNHLDPGDYAVGHPLAPKLPSMHWGWSAGYRFLAYEGVCGNIFNQIFQLHALGDVNYFQTEVELSATAIDNQITLHIDADYANGLEDIPVKIGLIEHSDSGLAKKALENFRDFVFSPSAPISSTIDLNAVNGFEVYPNPSFDGTVNLMVSTEDELAFDVVISDLLGRTIQQIQSAQSNTGIQINLEGSGLHFISVVADGKTLVTTKLLVN